MQPDQNNKSDPKRLDFIMQTELDKPKSLREKLQSKAGLALGAVVIVFISIVLIAFAMTSSKNNKEQDARLMAIAKAQSEIIGLSELATEQASQSSTKELASNIHDATSSSFEQVKAMLETRGTTIDEDTFASESNPETDSQLVESLKNKEFDDTFSSIIEEDLLNYQTLLVEAQKNANESEAKQLEDAYNNVDKILGLQDETPKTE